MSIRVISEIAVGCEHRFEYTYNGEWIPPEQRSCVCSTEQFFKINSSLDIEAEKSRVIKRALEVGWTQVDGKLFCKEHSKKESKQK